MLRLLVLTLLLGALGPTSAVELLNTLDLLDQCRTGGQLTQHPLALPQRRDPLNLIFQNIGILPPSSGGTIMEFLWIRDVLLAKLQRPVRVFDHASSDLMMNNSLVVALFQPHDLSYFKKAKAAGYRNVGLYHMGDEHMSFSTDYYQDADYVIRNYYNEEYTKRANVHYINLGTKSGTGVGVKETMLPSSMRSSPCNFIGSLRQDRADMIELFEKSGVKCFLTAKQGFESSDGMHAIHYRNTLLENVFTLAPWGENFESLRFYEALEFGSIPISKQIPDPNLDFFKSFGKDHPLPVVQNWTEAVHLVTHLLKNPKELDRLQARVLTFWTCFKDHMQTKAARIINRSFSRHGSSKTGSPSPASSKSTDGGDSASDLSNQN